MDLKSLNTFIQVAESGSFTRAGEQLGYSQPTISIQIKQLEKELGIQLFDRIGHTVRLTDKGHDILAHAQQICHMCQEMTTETARPSRLHGTIRLATADSMCSPLLSRGFFKFKETYPDISLKVVTAGTDELFRLLDHNEVDIVCTLDSRIYNTNYVIVAEENVGAHFIAAADSPLAKADSLAVTDLLAYPFLLTEKGMSYRRLLDELLAQQSIELRPTLELGRADIICDLVKNGAGIAFLPDYITESAVQSGSIVRLHVPGYEVELWKQLFYHRDKWLSPPMQVALAHFADTLLRTPAHAEKYDTLIPSQYP